MPEFRESLEIICSYLKVIGYLYILPPLVEWCLFSVEVCHAWYQQSRQNRWW